MHLVPKPSKRDYSPIWKVNEAEYPKIKKPGHFGIFLLEMWGTKAIDRLVYGYLLNRIRKGGNYRCCPSIKKLMAEVGVDASTIFRSLRKLEQYGWIKRFRTDSTTEYQLFSPETQYLNTQQKKLQIEAEKYAKKMLKKEGLALSENLLDEAETRRRELIADYIANNVAEA